MAGRVLIITDPTLLVRHANERLVMVRDKKQVAAMPVADISHVSLYGPVTMTGAAIASLLDTGVEVTLYSSHGRYRGAITSADPKNVYLLLAQVAAWKDDKVRLGFARPVVVGKIGGQRELVQRRAIDRASAACDRVAAQLRVFEARARESDDVQELRGIEGAASAAYFGVFGEMLSSQWTFPGRVRRPPTDPVNALLSLGYTVAVGEVSQVLTRAGFDTRIGLLHGIRYGRESLPLDLVEELRAPMVDRFVLRMLNRGQIKPEAFEVREGGAVRLTPEGLRTFFELWEEMMAGRAPGEWGELEGGEEPEVVGREEGQRGERETVTWRRRIEEQVGRLRRYIMNGTPYEPVRVRSTKKGGKDSPAGGEASNPKKGLTKVADRGRKKDATRVPGWGSGRVLGKRFSEAV